MTDHEGEQAMELEALEAIFPDQLEEFEGNTPEGWSSHGRTWAITIHPSADMEAEDAGADGGDGEPELQMQLVWAHTPTYPDDPPCIRLRSIRGLSDADLQEATSKLQQHIEESLGMPMIYNLVTAAQEWLAERVAAGPGAAGAGQDPDAEEKKRREAEEAARAAARAHGVPVTAERFLEWKARFEAERKAAAAAAAAAASGGKGGDGKDARLTGRQWFMQQHAAGKDESSGSEAGELEDDEEDFVAAEDDEDEDVDFDEEDEDEDDEEMLEEYLATKAS